MIEGLDAGADDYVVKPYDPQELQVRLRTGRRILLLQEQLIAAREAMREQATHDALTGLYNRAATLELLSKELGRQQRHGGSVGLVLVDLDRFKQINDQHGHLIGDRVLREASQAMLKCTRPYDFVGRFGGEEFLVALPGCDLINAISHAERMRSRRRASVHRTARRQYFRHGELRRHRGLGRRVRRRHPNDPRRRRRPVPRKAEWSKSRRICRRSRRNLDGLTIPQPKAALGRERVDCRIGG